jgi:hypothetical protein
MADLHRAVKPIKGELVKQVARTGKTTGLAAKAAAFAAIGLLAAAAAPEAQATVVVTTYQGVVADGFDTAGFFGTPGADLTGEAFTAVYTLDLATSTNFKSPPGAFVDNFQYGFGSSSLTIGGATIVSPWVEEYRYIANSSQYIYGWSNLDNYAGSIEFQTGIIGSSLLNSVELTQPLSYKIVDGDGSTGFGHFTGTDRYGNSSNIGLSTEQVEVTTDAIAVPEPTAWTLMLTGFLGAGAALRGLRRRRQAALAA